MKNSVNNEKQVFHSWLRIYFNRLVKWYEAPFSHLSIDTHLYNHDLMFDRNSKYKGYIATVSLNSTVVCYGGMKFFMQAVVDFKRTLQSLVVGASREDYETRVHLYASGLSKIPLDYRVSYSNDLYFTTGALEIAILPDVSKKLLQLLEI